MDIQEEKTYSEKFEEMQTYIPFLESMIVKLEKTSDKSREAQLSKMKSLRVILSNSKKKLKLETLQRCEDILKKLMEKVEKSCIPKPKDKTADVDVADEKLLTNSEGKTCINKSEEDQLKDSKSLGVSSNVKKIEMTNDGLNLKYDKSSDVSKSKLSQNSDDEKCVNTNHASFTESREKLKKIIGHQDPDALEKTDHLDHSPSPSRNFSFQRRLHIDRYDGSSPRSRFELDKRYVSSSPRNKFESDKRYDNSIPRGRNESDRRYDGSNLRNRYELEKKSENSSSKNRFDFEGKFKDRHVETDNEKNLSRDGVNSPPVQDWFSQSFVNSIEKNLSYINDQNTESASWRISLESTHEEENLEKAKSQFNDSPPVQVSVDLPTDEVARMREEFGPRSIRAKLEQEINKVHRVGTSTGGALRALANRDEKIKSPQKNYSETKGDAGELKVKDTFRTQLGVKTDQQDSVVDCINRQSEQHSNLIETKKFTEENKDVETFKVCKREIPDPRLKRGVAYARNVEPANNYIESNSGPIRKTSGILAAMSPEELERVVSENLQNLPLPAITPEVLQTVKFSNSSRSSGTWNPALPTHKITMQSSLTSHSGTVISNYTEAFGSSNSFSSPKPALTTNYEQRRTLLPAPVSVCKDMKSPLLPTPMMGLRYDTPMSPYEHSSPNPYHEPNVSNSRIMNIDPMLNTQLCNKPHDPRLARSSVMDRRNSDKFDSRYMDIPHSPREGAQQWAGTPCYGVFSGQQEVTQNYSIKQQYHSHGVAPRDAVPSAIRDVYMPHSQWRSQPQTYGEYRASTGRGYPPRSRQTSWGQLTDTRRHISEANADCIDNTKPVLSRNRTLSERDPRRRSIEENESRRLDTCNDRKLSRPDSLRSKDPGRTTDHREKDKGKDWDVVFSESSSDNTSKKSKDSEVISPLDSLYSGSLNPKTGRGYGIQHFKIPKIKREMSQKSDKPMSAASSSHDNSVLSTEKEISTETIKSDGVDSVKPPCTTTDDVKDVDDKKDKLREEVTQEFIEALIRKSLESGEGKKLLEYAKLLESLPVKPKTGKLKKIRRILESDSEESGSDKEEKIKDVAETATEKESKSKTRRIISSDDSGDENELETTKQLESSVIEIKNNDSKQKKRVQLLSKEENIPEQNEKVPEAKPIKKRSRRSPLELLQDDIREMFISEGVVTATGYRMCRLLKEQPGMTIDEISKIEAKRVCDEVDNESDCSSLSNKGKKDSSVTKKGRSKKVDEEKGMKKVDNVSPMKETIGKYKAQHKGKKAVSGDKTDNNAEIVEKVTEVEEDAGEYHSPKRGRKYKSCPQKSIKEQMNFRKGRPEPRVLLEKTDLSKLNTRKIDDDFSDSSLDRISIKPNQKSKKKSKSANQKKKGKYQKKYIEYETDAESVVSDQSLATDCTAEVVPYKCYPPRPDFIFKRRGKPGRAKLNKNIEEVVKRLSLRKLKNNDSDSLSAKLSNSTDECDVDINKINISAEKKKSRWQLEVIRKRIIYRPKLVISTSEETSLPNSEKDVTVETAGTKLDTILPQNLLTKAVAEPENVDSNLLVSNKTDIMPEKKIVGAIDKIGYNDNDGSEIEYNSANTSISADYSKNEENEEYLVDATAATNSTNLIISKELQESSITESNETGINNKVSADNIDSQNQYLTPSKDTHDSYLYDSEVFKQENNLHDISYAFKGSMEYNCKLCDFHGKSITHHYKHMHSSHEIYISRLSPSEAEEAIFDSENMNYDSECISETGKKKKPTKYSCRMCSYVTLTLLSFFEHLTTHTGEYKYQCKYCSYWAAARSTFKCHFNGKHYGMNLSDGMIVSNIGPGKCDSTVYGYLCSNCNFVQINKGTIEKHISKFHKSLKDVKVIKINLSKVPMAKEKCNLKEDVIQSTGPVVHNDTSEFVVDKSNDVMQLKLNKINDIDTQDNEAVTRENSLKSLDAKIEAENQDLVTRLEPNLDNCRAESQNEMNVEIRDATFQDLSSFPDDAEAKEDMQAFVTTNEQDQNQFDVEKVRLEKMQFICKNLKEEQSTYSSEDSILQFLSSITNKIEPPVNPNSLQEASPDIPQNKSDKNCNNIKSSIKEVSHESDSYSDIAHIAAKKLEQTQTSKDIKIRRITRSLSKMEEDEDDEVDNAQKKHDIEDDSASDVVSCSELTDDEVCIEDETTSESNIDAMSNKGAKKATLLSAKIFDRFKTVKSEKQDVIDLEDMSDDDYPQDCSSSLSVIPKPPILALSSCNNSLPEHTNYHPTNICSVKVAELEVKRFGDKLLFSCLIKGCIFATTTLTHFEKHYQYCHKLSRWDGFCAVCNKTLKIDKSFKTELSFACSHLVASHLKKLSSGEYDLANSESDQPSSAETSNLEDQLSAITDNVVGSSEPDQSSVSATTDVPKLYLRTRRLSGDKLSLLKPSDLPSDGEISDETVTSTSVDEITNEEVPFLKIASVVSLNPDVVGKNLDQPNNVSDVLDIGRNLSGSSTDLPQVSALSSSCNTSLIFTNASSQHSPTVNESLNSSAATKFRSVLKSNVGSTKATSILTIGHTFSGKKIVISPIKSAVGKTSTLTVLPHGNILTPVSTALGTTITNSTAIPIVNVAKPVTLVASTELSNSDKMTSFKVPRTFVCSSVVGGKYMPAILPKGPFFTLSPEKAKTSTQRFTSLINIPDISSTSPPILALQSGNIQKPNSTSVTLPNVSNATSTSTTSSVSQLSDDPSTPLLKQSTLSLKQSTPSSKQSTSSLSSPTKKLLSNVNAVKKTKAAAAWKKVITPVKLRHFFKCMVRVCSYTTDLTERFTVHCKMHLKAEENGWEICAYCNFEGHSPQELVDHIISSHGHCLYQCSHCFFRAAAQCYVVVHQKSGHVSDKVYVLLCPKLKDLYHNSSVLKPLDEIVKPYICAQGSCHQRFFLSQDFVRHLERLHSPLTSFSCHECSSDFLKAQRLIAHYRLHFINTLQCRHCLYGCENDDEMLLHLTSKHTDFPPLSVLRMIPTEQRNIQEVKLESLSIKNYEKSLSIDAIIPPPEFDDDDDDDDDDVCGSPKLVIDCEEHYNEHTNISINEQEETESAIAALKSESESLNQLYPEEKSDSSDDIMVIYEQMPTNKCSKMSNEDGEIARSCSSDDEVIVVSPNKNRSQEKSASKSPEIIDLDTSVEEMETEDNASGNTCEDFLSTQVQQNNADFLNSKQCTENKEIPTMPNKNQDLYKSNETNNIESSLNLESEEDLDIMKKIMDTGLSGEALYICCNTNCTFRAKDCLGLKEHLAVCDFARDSLGLSCIHCKKMFKTIGSLLDHLRIHGLKRFGCSLCEFRASISVQVTKHMKMRHRVTSFSIMPLIPRSNNHETDLFVVLPKEKGKWKRSKDCQDHRNKRVFSPEEIHLLPVVSVTSSSLQCSLCNFQSKVRSNIVRHLKQHLDPSIDDAKIPTHVPVNPVPCLETNEMMFDKMTNLAASSHIGGRMGGRPNTDSTSAVEPPEEEYLPKFVPENRRYVCGAPECSYLTCDETMLRHHLRALHGNETAYRCPHCPESLQENSGQVISIDRLGTHLKMHDSRLYKCAHCTYNHFQKHVVERHLSDKHPEKRLFVQVIREPSAETAIPKRVEASGSFNSNVSADNSSNCGGATSISSHPIKHPWRCGLCNYRGPTRFDALNHVSSVHGMKSQFKCGICNFRSSSRGNFDLHFSAKHPLSQKNIINVFFRVEEEELPVPATPENNPISTNPLWTPDPERIRHIRGILMHDDEEQRQYLQLYYNQCESTNLSNKEESQGKKSEAMLTEEESSERGLYGPYGKPAPGNLYMCPLCKKYKTKFKMDMRDHLYRELDYTKWVCTHCGLTSCSRNALQKHSAKVHMKDRKPEAIAPLKPEKQLEDWVQKVLSVQYSQMEINCKLNAVPTVPASEDISETTNKKRALDQVCLNEAIDIAEKDINGTVDGLEVRSSDILHEVVNPSSPKVEIGSDFNNLRGIETVSPAKQPTKSKTLEKTLPCKHCSVKFHNTRGLKLHIRMNHLGLRSWLCGYCDHTAISEFSIKQHLRAVHTGLPVATRRNEKAIKTVLDDAFWLREYGISTGGDKSIEDGEAVESCSPRKRRKLSLDIDSAGSSHFSSDFNRDMEAVSDMRKCMHCNYTCKSSTDLRNHEMRHWTQKPFRCGYCEFEGVREYEIKKHILRNHPLKDILVLTNEIPDQPEIKPLRLKRKHESQTVSFVPENENHADAIPEKKCKEEIEDLETKINIEQPVISSECDDTAIDVKKVKIYRCYYCPQRATSLVTVHAHWQKIHKNSVVSTKGFYKAGLPFRYKELDVNEMMKGNVRLPGRRVNYSCSYCKKKGTIATLNKHHIENHPNLPFEPKQLATAHYECTECHFVSYTLNTLRRHFEVEHPGLGFGYTVRTIQPCEDVVIRDCTLSPENNVDSTIIPNVEVSTSTATQFSCDQCNMVFELKNQLDKHSIMDHSPLLDKSTALQDVFNCSRCPFSSALRSEMHDHLGSHIIPMTCPYCAEEFSFPADIRSHIICSHPKLPAPITIITEAERQLLKLEKECGLRNVATEIFHNEECLDNRMKTDIVSTVRKLPVARKSTALPPMVKARAVARKSTCPISLSSLPGYKQHLEFAAFQLHHSESKPYSFYRTPMQSLDLDNITVAMYSGDMKVNVNFKTFSDIVDLNCEVRVKDIRKDSLFHS